MPKCKPKPDDNKPFELRIYYRPNDWIVNADKHRELDREMNRAIVIDDAGEMNWKIVLIRKV